MTELRFKGKEFVYNHHLAVPFRPLVMHPEKGIGEPSLDGNLIIQGDNLHALKALLPHYAGKVDCIFIDPPYNTGNEGWCYNDNVNAPMIQEWLAAGPIGRDDGLRHDKWCAMMWPRLRLLHEFLAEYGVIFVSTDDNEMDHLRLLMNEIFGNNNFIACLPTIMNLKGNNDEFGFSGTHEYTLCYCKNKESAKIGEFDLDEEDLEKWKEDQYGYFKKGANLKATGGNAPREKRQNLYYPIFVDEHGKVMVTADDLLPAGDYETVFPITDGQEMSWRWSKEKIARQPYDVIVEKTSNGYSFYKKQRPSIGDLPSRKPKTIFYKPEYSSGNGTAQMKEVFGEKKFDNPKPLQLILDILALGTDKNSIVLDSFAGSGTTAHAVLDQNQRDGGNRKFILVECEDYADSITAERVRRVVDGIPRARSIELQKGLGGAFTYCTLGPPLELDRLLSGENLPPWQALGVALFHMATNRTLEPTSSREPDFYVGKAGGRHIWLIYRPDCDWLKSDEAALTLTRAREFVVAEPEGEHLVFAAARFVDSDLLAEEKLRVEFAPLPFTLYRLDRS